MKKQFLFVVLCIFFVSLTGCDTEAQRVSQNISQEADNFNVIRRLSVINTRTDKPLFELTAAFSITTDATDNQLEITCEVGDGVYKKHFVYLNKDTFYVIEDVSGAAVDKYHYEVNFLPEMINPIKITSKD